jgi:hypothetical protein
MKVLSSPWQISARLHLATLLTGFVALANFSWGQWGDIAHDMGHELETAVRLWQGETLYRDVQSPYGPVSYFVNSWLLGVFGNRLETFYAAGLASTLVLLILLYWMLRPLVGGGFAFLTGLVVMTHCFFRPGLFNFVMPYTYAATYALILAMIQCYLLTRTPTGSSTWRVVCCGGLAGLVVMSKIEFGVASLGAGVVYLLMTTPKSIPQKGLCLGQYLGAALLSIGAVLIFLLPHVSLESILSEIVPIQRWSIIQKALSSEVSPLNTIRSWGIGALSFAGASLVIGVGLYLGQLGRWFGDANRSRNKKWDLALGSALAFGGLLLGLSLTNLPLRAWTPLLNLQWLVLALPLWAVYTRPALPPAVWPVALYLYVFTVLLNLRSDLDIPFPPYPITAFALILLFCLLLGCTQGEWRKWAGAYLAVSCVFTTLRLGDYYSQPTYTLHSSLGSIRTQNLALGASYQSAIDFLQKIPAADQKRVLVLPDGALLNYLSRTHAPVRQLFLNPAVLATPEEEKQWIKTLQQVQPSYILLVNALPPDTDLADFNPTLDQWVRSQHRRTACFGLVEVFAPAKTGSLAASCKV